jgi:hypothetical protein
MILNIFFSIKLIRQSRGAKKIFREDKLPKVLPKNTVFQNPGGPLPPWALVHPPLGKNMMDIYGFITYPQFRKEPIIYACSGSSKMG